MAMRDDSSARKLPEPTSLFPAAEAPSFCSRQTPVVPPPTDALREWAQESFPADLSGAYPIPTPSSRPTVGPGELDAFPYVASDHIPSDRPTLTADEVLAEMIERATVGTPIPAAHAAVTLAATPRARRATRRTIVARAVFTLGFGGVLALLGYALQPRLAGALRELGGRAPVATPAR
jgi:hypothetical protein